MRITIELSDQDAEDVKAVVAMCATENSTHGKLTAKRLAEMLMQDVALANRRRGSWEGSKMGDLLSSHGYQV